MKEVMMPEDEREPEREPGLAREDRQSPDRLEKDTKEEERERGDRTERRRGGKEK